MDKFDNTIEIEAESLNLFNFVTFRKFLIENGVIATAVSYVIGSQINNLITSILDNVIQPMMEADYNNDNKDDFTPMKKWVLKLGPYKFKLGQLFFDLLKFGLVMYCVFIVSRLFIDTLN
mgnify:CR=1 FL=1|tara:strand:+ start:2880 stop:3239 length:360 start_codon:yes stop_codon:yes gene_type:complete